MTSRITERSEKSRGGLRPRAEAGTSGTDRNPLGRELSYPPRELPSARLIIFIASPAFFYAPILRQIIIWWVFKSRPPTDQLGLLFMRIRLATMRCDCTNNRNVPITYDFSFFSLGPFERCCF